ncbi:Crp/Fnr family transcriptional regulator [Thioalkalivibrio thiocyanodenitrificans]|uniref:Crp/Fnr family transcriptional regulator n=1 Tax=Thioalkalivibrio thiocyanodenitrificans TaxID=243063 RepID=UPI0003795207|nr:Crp/Fnr family transcriptional regulator [Thioalkalivibrio thiocyanodenitrificans]
MRRRPHLFAELAPADAAVLTSHGSVRSYPANTVLITEGDQVGSLYVLLEGRVKVFASDDAGREVILSILGPGEYFGELSLVDEAPRSASVMSLAPVKLMAITQSQVRQCLSENTELAFNLIRALTREVRVLTDNIKTFALMDVYGRVTQTLIDLAVEKDGKLVIEPRLTHQDIANMVGASREMVSRILKELVTGNYVSVDKHSMTINEKLPAAW